MYRITVLVAGDAIPLGPYATLAEAELHLSKLHEIVRQRGRIEIRGRDGQWLAMAAKREPVIID